jgi:dihydropteroate synthase
MHMLGEPGTMQDAPHYEDAALDVYDYLADRVMAVETAGVARSRIAVDPGIGFGKTRLHNVEILARLSLYQGLGCAVTLGVSRKSLIAGLDRDLPPKQRVAGSLAAALVGVQRGAHILRVHDVAETRQALAVWRALEGRDDASRPAASGDNCGSA